MKEAAGEANMTVITIVLIAIVLGVGTLIVSRLMNNTETQAEKNIKGEQDCTYNETTGKYTCK